MSGSDPSVGRPVSGGVAGASFGGDGPGDGCPGTAFETAVGSPYPDAVDGLLPGELLDVVPVDDDGVRGVLFRTLEGADVGALVTNILRLRSCMAAGWRYEAIVVQKAGGSVIVEVKPAQA